MLCLRLWLPDEQPYQRAEKLICSRDSVELNRAEAESNREHRSIFQHPITAYRPSQHGHAWRVG
jgi:hypothetical protein